jgi:thiamine biosynthesis lipoprotein
MVMASAEIRRARPLLGTFVEIIAIGPEPSGLEAAAEAAFAAIAKVHRLMSFHDPASDVSRLNRAAARGPVRVDASTWDVIAAAVDLNRRSHGSFDIAVAPLLQGAGLLPPAAAGGTDDATPAGGDAIEMLAGHRIRFRGPGTRIDLGGIAKGFAVDRAIEALRARGVGAALVNAGGDLAAFGPSAWPIHLRDPRDPRETIGAIEIRDEALASTGGGFDPIASPRVIGPAVFDPRASAPATAIAGATVRAPSAMVADALTKLVMIDGEAAAGLLAPLGASALMVRHDGEIRITPSWQAARAA